MSGLRIPGQRVREMYASYSDEDLLRAITEECKAVPGQFHPETHDLRKRGLDPLIALEIIADMQYELLERLKESQVAK